MKNALFFIFMLLSINATAQCPPFVEFIDTIQGFRITKDCDDIRGEYFTINKHQLFHYKKVFVRHTLNKVDFEREINSEVFQKEFEYGDLVIPSYLQNYYIEIRTESCILFFKREDGIFDLEYNCITP
jgi:hypothetical protein